MGWYLSYLLTVIRVDDSPVVCSSIEHFEIPPILIDSPLLRPFASLLKVRFANPAQEGHDEAFIAVLAMDCPCPSPMFVLTAKPWYHKRLSSQTKDTGKPHKTFLHIVYAGLGRSCVDRGEKRRVVQPRSQFVVTLRAQPFLVSQLPSSRVMQTSFRRLFKAGRNLLMQSHDAE